MKDNNFNNYNNTNNLNLPLKRKLIIIMNTKKQKGFRNAQYASKENYPQEEISLVSQFKPLTKKDPIPEKPPSSSRSKPQFINMKIKKNEPISLKNLKVQEGILYYPIILEIIVLSSYIQNNQYIQDQLQIIGIDLDQVLLLLQEDDLRKCN